MLDAVVVGGGPAGSASARLLASRGYGVRVLEEHPCSGRPVQCAGLVSDGTIRMSGVSPDVLSTLYGAEVVFPDGETLSVRSSTPKIRAVDRAQLDQLMADAASDAGAEFSCSDKMLSYSLGDGFVEASSRTGSVRCRALIGADGHSSAVASSFGDNGPREYVRGVQADVKAPSDLDGMFRARLGSRYAPGFFTWEFPCGDFVRVGLCASWSAGPPYQYLKRMLDDLYPGCRVLSKSCGKIPLGGRRTVCSDRRMLIGDAAGQVKPISGGGIYPSLMAAPILADVLSSALESDDLSRKSLLPYERRCRKVFGKELERSYRIRRLFLRMDDDELSAAGRFASRDDVRVLLDDIDIDHPGNVVKKVLSKPSTLPAGLVLLMRCVL
ncbi:MAG: NAD(P)/FAD-dependent oxidoreductase [Candidatus Methanomethylophilaceae archaeon]|nr:NAD(P)/FAD-dependent oxidoreductase [Candidatus Methanomethylophilaceae archaeon]